MPFSLSPLPFDPTAFEPHISARTFSFHHGKHHQTYVTNLNGLVAGTELEDKTLEELVKTTARDPEKEAVFNNAAQAWNHDFFWRSLSPEPKAPSSALTRRLDDSFGGLAAFKDAFKRAGLARFGSGWVWLVERKDGTLGIVTTPNAQTPLTTDETPLVTCDVWEHAYYLDHQNRRADFLQLFLDRFLNWEFAESRLAS